MTDRKITDRGVAGLPVREGRAELLEEIMSLSTEDHHHVGATDELGARRRTRWLPVAGAAAAVAAIAATVAVPQLLADDEKNRVVGGPAAAPGSGEIAVLDAPGWTLDDADSVDEGSGELEYVSGQQSLEISWAQAESYEEYVEDRSHIDHPKVDPGEPLTVLGKPALLWPYSRTDHTVIRAVVGDFWLEFRGTGMKRPAFVALLDDLVAIAPSELDAHLPDEFVTDAERAGVVADMLDPLPVPDSFDVAALESDEVDRYQLGAHVTGAVTCAWLDQFEAAKAAGDDAAMQEAVDAMATSRDWPVLQEMQAEGDWSSVVWEYADAIAAGRSLAGYRQGIGCLQGTPE